MMPVLEKCLVDAKVPAVQRAQIVDILAASDDKKVGVLLLQVVRTGGPDEVRDKILSNLKQFLPGKWQNLRDNKEVKATIDALLSESKSRATGLALIGSAERMAYLPRVMEIAGNSKEIEPARKTAVQTLGQLPSGDSVHALRGLMEDKLVGDEVMGALGRLAQRWGDETTAGLAVNALQAAVSARIPARHAALSALAGTRPGTQWLLDQHAHKL